MNDNNIVGNANNAVDFLGNRWEFDCMGCAIAKKEIELPGGIVYEGKYMILGADPEIPIPGFLIITAKKHVNSFSELNKEERYEIADIIAASEKALKELNIASEVTIIQEERAKHLHIWIFPNHNWMIKKYGKGLKHIRDIMEYAKENTNEYDIKKILDTIEKIKVYINR